MLLAWFQLEIVSPKLGSTGLEALSASLNSGNFSSNSSLIPKYFLKSESIHDLTIVTIMCRNDELSWVFTNRFNATRCMKVKRMGTTEILRRIWLFSANKVKS